MTENVDRYRELITSITTVIAYNHFTKKLSPLEVLDICKGCKDGTMPELKDGDLSKLVSQIDGTFSDVILTLRNSGKDDDIIKT